MVVVLAKYIETFIQRFFPIKSNICAASGNKKIRDDPWPNLYAFLHARLSAALYIQPLKVADW